MKELTLILILLISTSLFGQWNNWNYWNIWGRSSLGPNLVVNGDFHDFTFDYSSIGEDTAFYTSDFSVDADGWANYLGLSTVNGNIDAVSDGTTSYDNCLRLTSDGTSLSARVYKNFADDFIVGQYYKVTGRFYIPSGQTVSGIAISLGNLEQVFYTNSTVGSWINFEVEFKAGDVFYQKMIQLRGISFNLSGEVIYFRDITIQKVGMVAHWIFDDYYNSQEGGGGYIGEDWAQGGAVYGTNYFPNPTISDLSNINVVGSVIATHETNDDKDGNDGILKADFQATGNTNYIQFSTPTWPTTGYLYQISFWAKRLSGSGSNLRGTNGYGFDITLTDKWRHYIIYNYILAGTAGLRVYITDAPAIVLFDGVYIKKMINGYHLQPSSGFEYTGQITGRNPAYKNGKALKFDGIDDYFYIPAAQATALNPGTGDFSITAWIKTSSTGIYQKIMEKYELTTLNYQLLVNSSNQARFTIKDGTSSIDLIGTSTITDGNWHLIVGIYSTTSGAKLYVDGNLEASTTSTLSSVSINGDFAIGARPGGSTFFNGYISEPAYFNRALYATEVMALYGKAKHWEWDGVGTLQNVNFTQVITGGGTLSQTVNGLDANKIYRETIMKNGFETIQNIDGVTSKTYNLTDGSYEYVRLQEGN